MMLAKHKQKMRELLGLTSAPGLHPAEIRIPKRPAHTPANSGIPRVPRSASVADGFDQITVVITNYRRPEMLWGAFQSARSSGARHIVIASSGADSSICAVHARILAAHHPTVITSRTDDVTCNETWLRGLRASRTKWVNILHDDDMLTPAWRKYESLVRAHPDMGFFHTNGSKHGNVNGGFYDTLPGKPTGVYSTDILWPHLLSQGGYALSPVSGLFRRDHLIAVLEECEKNLNRPEFFYRPRMLVGNDLLIWLRAVETYPKFYFSREPLVSYGHWGGSCSYEDCGKQVKALPGIYNATRRYYLYADNAGETRPLVHIESVFGTGNPAVEFASAAWSKLWDDHPNWKHRAVEDAELPRLFPDGHRKLPYLKDLIEAGMRGAPKDAIFILANSDIIPCQSMPNQLLKAFESVECAYSFRRDVQELKALDPVDIRLRTSVYAGVDLVAFTGSWWETHKGNVPDFVYGADAWDYALRLYMDKHGGRRFHYLIYHLAHTPETIYNKGSASQNHNRDLARNFLPSVGGIIYWDGPAVDLNPR